MATYLPYILALFLAVNLANGLKCYNCNTKDSSVCSWGLASFTYNTEECTSVGVLDSLVGPKCFKIIAKNKNGDEYIARGCQNPPAFGCKAIATAVGWFSEVGQEPVDMDCETCDTDKCNSASKVAGFTFLGVLLATFAFLF